ncbi:uncharacterized protein F4822DRAFT_280046 [Hypoxylon trugodes]|uniref:uncharacterized protein n=1 Tax=Hypoxylon trugodes TaxID=326681 RepID=UPI00218D019C|nr:uncharacterized protein F4822DRAFT_280046 [Hypoxylon trugodes]KAI1387357.1 hypothetical protein F4822DRAFT_280046 [Hypoxylon trugodes]
MASSAAPTAADGTTKLVKLTFLIKKRDDISLEEFHRYWRENHRKLAVSTPIFREKVVRYTQYHSDGSVDLKKIGIGNPGYDGAAIVWARSLEDLIEVFNHEDYLKYLATDEPNFLKRDEIITMFGWDELKLENGVEF